MSARYANFWKYAVTAVGVIAATVVGVRLTHHGAIVASRAAAGEVPAAAVEYVPGGKDSVHLSPETAARLGIHTGPVERSTASVTLELSGTLILDADRLSHVHARFPGEIVELGTAGPVPRPIGFGQHVRKGQLLAVIWSRDLGEKKSELIDAVSQLRVDEQALLEMSKASGDGAIPERLLRTARRQVEADRIATSRAVRTLQSWRIPQEEIDAVRAEATRLGGQTATQRGELVQQWARLEVRAPLDGVILARNVALGDLVDTTIDLFQIADLARLRVVAHAYEEDLPSLDAVPADRRKWSISVGAAADGAGRNGTFDQIGCIIDPNQHTALVMGWVDNADGRLRVGQFVTARLEIPPPPGEVVVPALALCEESDRTFVFVQSDGKSTYVRRSVAVTRRQGDTVCIRSQPTPEEKRRGLEPLAAGEQVVISRVVQLAACLDNLQQDVGAPSKDPRQR